MGELWKNERYFSSFEEADALRTSLLSGVNGTFLQVKIKRCGPDDSIYVVKSRVNPELKSAIEEVEEKLLVAKEKNKKSKK